MENHLKLNSPRLPSPEFSTAFCNTSFDLNKVSYIIQHLNYECFSQQFLFTLRELCDAASLEDAIHHALHCHLTFPNTHRKLLLASLLMTFQSRVVTLWRSDWRRYGVLHNSSVSLTHGWKWNELVYSEQSCYEFQQIAKRDGEVIEFVTLEPRAEWSDSDTELLQLSAKRSRNQVFFSLSLSLSAKKLFNLIGRVWVGCQIISISHQPPYFSDYFSMLIHAWRKGEKYEWAGLNNRAMWKAFCLLHSSIECWCRGS